MTNKLFFTLFCIIIIASLALRIFPTFANNFYFTMDQGNDAVHVREILERGQNTLKGPETGINGVFAGPLWYYILATGYKLFDSHPAGGLLVIILLNTILLGLVMLKVARSISNFWGIITGVVLGISWGFYDTSRYAFNPFLLVSLSFLLIFLLTDFLKGKNKSFIFAGAIIGLGFHAEVAGSLALFLFYFLIGLWSWIKRKTPMTILLASFVVFSLFFIPHFLSEFQSGFGQTRSLLREVKHPQGAFSDSSVVTVSKYLAEQISRTTFPQNKALGIILFLAVIAAAVRNFIQTKEVNKFVVYFYSLVLALLAVTWVSFSSNSGWRDWQTVYIYPLLLTSVLLLLSQLKKQIALTFIAIIFLSQSALFAERYKESLKISNDPSILANEIQAIDWVYQKGNGKGFDVYSYLPSAIDYPYQYLFWWHGIKKYKYVPCDYRSLPGAPKPFYIPGSMYYEDPKKECTNLRFLIIEPDSNTNTREQWLEGTRANTQLVDKTQIGKIEVEQRLFKR